MKNIKRIYLFDSVTVFIGAILLTLSIMFALKQQGIIAFLLLLGSLIFITVIRVVELDHAAKSITVFSKIGFWRYNNKNSKLQSDLVKIVILNIENRQYGIDKKPNIFRAFDIVLISVNGEKKRILTSLNEYTINRVGKFLATNLKLEVEVKEEKNF